MEYRISGNFIQYLEVRLFPGEEFYAEKGSVIYLESGVEKELELNGSKLGRIISAKLSGESLFMLRLYNATDRPRLVVVGSKCGLVPLTLSGETVICHRGVYVASCRRVQVGTKLSVTGLVGGMGLMLQKISGDTTVFLDSNGTPIRVPLGPGESIQVDENHIIALRVGSEQQLASNWSLKNVFGGEGLSMLTVTGPGEVLLSPGTFFLPEV